MQWDVGKGFCWKAEGLLDYLAQRNFMSLVCLKSPVFCTNLCESSFNSNPCNCHKKSVSVLQTLSAYHLISCYMEIVLVVSGTSFISYV